MKQTWEQNVNDMFNSEDIGELQLRAFCVYNVLKDRIYTEILPDVLEVIDKEGVNVKSDVWVVIWGKLTSAAIYLMTQTVLQNFKEKKAEADKHNVLVCKLFLEDFDEKLETLTEYERDNPNLGKAQTIWALGSQICKAIDRENATLATKIIVFWERIAKIEAETTPDILRDSFDKLKEKMLNLNFIKMGKE